MKTFKKLLSNQVNLVITPDKGFDYKQDISKVTRIVIKGDCELWLNTLGVCEYCGFPIKVNFCLGSRLLATPCLMEAPITCLKCKKTQIKKIKYHIEPVDTLTKPTV